MNMPVLTQIQENINRLSSDEQLWLIEWLARRVREKTGAQSVWEKQLADMAADPEIQSELQRIDAEFAVAEADGLEAMP
jgi:hypothetical protein